MLSHFAHVSHSVMQPCSPCTLISATDAVPYLHHIQYRIWTVDPSGCRRTCTSACLQTQSQACIPVSGYASEQLTFLAKIPHCCTTSHMHVMAGISKNIRCNSASLSGVTTAMQGECHHIGHGEFVLQDHCRSMCTLLHISGYLYVNFHIHIAHLAS